MYDSDDILLAGIVFALAVIVVLCIDFIAIWTVNRIVDILATVVTAIVLMIWCMAASLAINELRSRENS